jgi:hypothetical protein
VNRLPPKHPRQRDAGYLQWLRWQRCACGCLRGPPSDAAHLRASSLAYDKPISGLGRKPDDKWALPLNHRCHMDQHRHGDEQGWWRDRGVADPFALCLQHYRRYERERSKR